MVQKYKIPKTNSKPEEAISIEQALNALAHNKHNDLTTIYYLLHRKWMASINNKKEKINPDQNMVVLTPANYE